jgi:hypothetical protein
VDAAKVMVHELKSDDVLMIFELLGKGICQARKSSHGHAHAQI